MNLRRRMQDVGNMEQLHTVVTLKGGEVAGQFWTIQVEGDNGDGGEQEIGTSGTYSSRWDNEANAASLVFESTPTPDDRGFSFVVNENSLAYGAVKVFCRREI